MGRGFQSGPEERRLIQVLDSWAVVAVLRHEPAGPRVKKVIDGGDALISWINLGEVFYVEARRVGDRLAEAAILEVRRLVKVDRPDGDLVMAAGRIKAGGAISYADCFALATAERHGAPLLTGDPEIIGRAGEVGVVDLRSTD